MGKLETTIILNDKFSKQLENINRAIHSTTRAMASLQKAQLSSAQLLRYEELQLAQAKELTKRKILQKQTANIKLQQIESKRKMLAESHARTLERQNVALQNQQSKYQGIFGQMQLWASRLRNILTMYYGIRTVVQGIGKAVALSDKMTMTDAKFNLVANGDKKLAGDLKAKTFAAAQRSTTDYLEFGKAVGKLGVLAGDKFKNQDSIVRFVELMNKSFQISGADTSERNAAMLQITQAIASNRLQGDEFRSILENAPMVMDALTKSLGVGHDKLKAMAKEGELTADVLIKAMFDAGDKIEKMYSQLDMTWERHWAKFKNVYVLAFQPIQEQLKRLFNSEQFQSFVNGLCTAMIVLGNMGGWALEKLFNGINNIVEGFSKFINWVRNLTGVLGKLRDIIIALTTALILYKGYQLIVLGFTKLQVLWTTLLGLKTLALEAAIRLAKTAKGLYIACQIAYNQAATIGAGITAILQTLFLNLSVIIGIILVAALILFVMWLYKSSESAADAVGKIVGSFYWLWAAICNVFIWIGNMFSGVCQWLVNTWDWWCDNFGAVCDNIGIWWDNLWLDARTSFYGFINDVLTKLSSLAEKIQPIAKLLDIDLSGMIGKAQASITGKINGLESQKKSYKSLTTLKDSNWNKFEYKDLGEAYDKGYKKGYDATIKVTDKMEELKKQLEELKKVELNGDKVTSDALNGLNDKLGEGNDYGANTANNTGDIAANTSSTEDYSYLRNWAYNKGMGNSIGYNIKIEQNNKNNIGSNMDLNRVVDAVRDAIIEGIMTQAEGVR